MVIKHISVIFFIFVSLWLQAQNLQSNQGSSPLSDAIISKIENLKEIGSLISPPKECLPQIDSLLLAKAQLIQSKIDNLKSKTSRKLNDLDSLSNSRVGELLNDQVDELTPEQYTSQLNDINQSLEQYKSKITDTKELAWVEHYAGQMDQLDEVIKEYQDKLLNLEELQALNSYQQQLEQLSGEAGGYFQELQEIVSSGLTDESPLMQQLESKIGDYPEFKELQKLSAKLEQAKRMPEDYQDKLKGFQDKDRIKARAKDLVNKHFSQHQDRLQAAQQKLATFKKKYSSIQSTKDMSTAVKRNSLEGKPLSERLVLGGTFQINPSHSQSNGQPLSTTGSSGGGSTTSKVPTSVDLSPLLGYRFNKKLTLGIGATYRAILEIDEFEAKNQVYGYRGFFQREAVKGFFVHGEYERMNTAVESSSTSTAPTDEIYRRWKSGALAGVGKGYSFIKKIKGQVMVLYDFLHEDGVSPYKRPWVIRFGFVM